MGMEEKMNKWVSSLGGYNRVIALPWLTDDDDNNILSPYIGWKAENLIWNRVGDVIGWQVAQTMADITETKFHGG